MRKHFEQIFCVCSDFHRKQLHQQTFQSSQIETSQKLHNMMDAKDKSLRLASSSSSSSTNFTVDTTATDSSESGSSMTISGDVHTKSSKGMSSEQKNSNSVERKTTSSGKPLNFGVDSILRANTELRSALGNRLNSAFEIVRLVSSKSAGSSKRTTSRSSNASSSSPSSSSSSSSSTSDPLGSRAMMNLDSMSHLTNLTPYEIYAATKAYNDTLHSSATGSNGNATSEPSFGHQQHLQQVPPTVRSAINEQQQPSFSSLYQYYASLNGGNGCGGGTLIVAPDSAGSQALHHEQLNLGSSWPTMSAGYEALGTAAAASTASSLNKSLPSPHLALIDSYFLNDHAKANSSGSTLMGPTIESCLSSVYQQYSGGVPYNQSGSSSSFYPSYSTLMNMAGQAGGGGGPKSPMAQHQHQQLLLANSRKLINGGAAHLINLREQQQQQQLPAIHKQQSMPISSVNGISPTLAHHHHHHPQQQQSQASTSHSHNGSSGSSGGGGNNHQHASSKKGKRSWSRAVFSNTQRRGLEKRFLQQKYITKPDRRKLAEWLGLTDAQVKVWFQNRRMKWRRSEAYQALMLASSEHCQHELSSLMAKAEVMQAGNLHARGKGKDFIWASSQQRPAAPEVPPRTSSSSNSGSTGHMTVAAAAYSRAPEMFNPSHTGGIISQAGHAGQSSLLTSNVAANLNHNSSVCSSPGSPSSPRSSLSSCHSGANMSAAVPVPMSSPQLSAVVPVIGGGSNSSNKSSSVLHEQPMQYLLSVK